MTIETGENADVFSLDLLDKGESNEKRSKTRSINTRYNDILRFDVSGKKILAEDR